ncbi:MAG: hypothetical protein AAF348_18665 [Bacteroidota bacterium]
MLKEIFTIQHYHSKLYINRDGKLFWNSKGGTPRTLESLPKNIQTLFYIKFIRDHQLASLVSGIAPLACIELYIKAKFLKRIFIFFAITITSIYCVRSQAVDESYEFINTIYNETTNIIHVEQEFKTLNPFKDLNFVSEKFFRDEWQPIKIGEVPDIEAFLLGISIQHLNDFANQKQTFSIDSSKLNSKIKVVYNLDQYLKEGGIVSQISRPFMSCTKEWAIIYTSSYSKDFSGGGNWYIYRKVDGKWVYYHKINIFMT